LSDPENFLGSFNLGITVLPIKTITFKVSDDEARLIRSLAKQQRTSLSEYLRRRATGTENATMLPQRVRCEFTGAMIFGPMPGLPPLTDESVREMLSDFP
jgi:hypothetical protein